MAVDSQGCQRANPWSLNRERIAENRGAMAFFTSNAIAPRFPMRFLRCYQGFAPLANQCHSSAVLGTKLAQTKNRCNTEFLTAQA